MNCFSPDKNYSLSSILIHPGACYLFVRVFARTSKCNISQTNIFLNQSSSSFFVYMLWCSTFRAETRSQVLNFILLTLHIKCFLFFDISLPSRISLEFYHFSLSVGNYFLNFPLRISQLSDLASNVSKLSHFPLYQGWHDRVNNGRCVVGKE